MKFNFKYRIKYKYSLISAKPNLVYKPESNIYYDAILCYGPYEANYLKVYSKTELIGNLKYLNFEKKPNIINTDKKILLYLPTYGDVSSIDSILESLNKLKEKYYIITKFHHGTSFLKSENERIIELKQLVDEYYDHKTELVELLSNVDVVLSDNSGSIFEAIYAKVPVAIYSTDINKNKLKNFDTVQYKLVQEGYIPYSNNAYEIENILDQSLSETCIQKQNELRKSLFYLPEDPLNSFIKVIEKYLNDNINHDYKNLHDILIEDYNTKAITINHTQSALLNYENETIKLKDNIEKYKKELSEKNLLISIYEKTLANKNLIISYYEKGKLYKISKKIYKLYYKLNNKE